MSETQEKRDFDRAVRIAEAKIRKGSEIFVEGEEMDNTERQRFYRNKLEKTFVVPEEKWLRIQKLMGNRPKFEYGLKETESAHFHKLYHHIIELDRWFEDLEKEVCKECDNWIIVKVVKSQEYPRGVALEECKLGRKEMEEFREELKK
jgi:hypothetical protein